MCGIVGIISNEEINSKEIIKQSLKRLQNRGYDSCGIALLENDQIKIKKYISNNFINCIDLLEEDNDFIMSNIALGHNRWSTHGKNNIENSHPHISNNERYIIVHNGTILNYLELKDKLLEEGYIFYSSTDTEVIINLIEYYYNNNMKRTIKKVTSILKGCYSFVLYDVKEKNNLYAYSNNCPLVFGKSKDYIMITSETNGFNNDIKEYYIVKDNEILDVYDTLPYNCCFKRELLDFTRDIRTIR
jgi:glucosamine--fructose-6-phosphate aminotransferase (isomerizing)